MTPAARLRAYREPPFLLVLAGGLLIATFLAWLSIERHDRFGSGTDFALFSQAIWLLGHLHEPFLTVHARHLFGEHFQPAFLVYAPLGLLDATAVLVFQAFALAAVAPLLYLIARGRGAGAWLAALLGGLWLLTPLMHNAALFEFHPETLAPLLLAAAVLALDRDRGLLFALLALGAGLLKEDVMVAVCVLGVVVAVTTRRRRLGAAVAGIAAATVAFAVTVVIPHYGESLIGYRRRFAGDRGETFGDVAGWMLAHPGGALADLFVGPNIALVAALVLTTAGLAFLEPWLLVPALPALANNLLTAQDYPHRIETHYQLVVVAFVAIAGAAGAATLHSAGRHARLGAAGLATVAVLWFVSGIGSAVPEHVRALDGPHVFDIDGRRAALALVSDRESVAAPNDVAAHLAGRSSVFRLPEPFFPVTPYPGWSTAERLAMARDVDVVIYENGLHDEGEGALARGYRRIPAELGRRGFREVARFGKVVVYRR